ncbi:MAG: hypothetical protein LUF90_02490 [Rikenellaceae bacterium]|nr:hypothetical protein [Rikenellaceae bacterium]
MKNNPLWVDPFRRIAGAQALLYGLIGMVASLIISLLTNYHYHGLLHFGSAPNNSEWVFIAEHLVVWLIPATLFYLCGLFFSRSKIRFIDVYGTVSFALLPLLPLQLISIIPGFNDLLRDPIGGVMLAMFPLTICAWMLIWLFDSLKVSCNLKGSRLWMCYLFSIYFGDIICRIIITNFYRL